MNDAPEQQGSLIRPDQAAFVVDADGRISLRLPPQELDEPLAPGHRLLLALAVRLNDPEWVEELMAGVGGARPARKLGFL